MPGRVLVHKHRRKRVHEDLEPYPHPDKKINNIDKIVDVLSYVYPITIFPQLYNIWILGDVGGVSLLTWGSFIVFNTLLIYYAYVHKDRKLLIMYSLFTILYVFIVIGVLIN